MADSVYGGASRGMSAPGEGELPDFGHLLEYCANDFGEARVPSGLHTPGQLGSQFPGRFLGSGLPLGNGLPGGMSVAQLQHSLQQQAQNRGLPGFGLHPSNLPFMPMARASHQPGLGRAGVDYPAEDTAPGREMAHLNAPQQGWPSLGQSQHPHHQHSAQQLPSVLKDSAPLSLSQLLRHQQGLGPAHMQPQHGSHLALHEQKPAAPSDQPFPASSGPATFPQLPGSSQPAETGSGALDDESARPGASSPNPTRLASNDLLDEGRSKLPGSVRHRGEGSGAEVTKAKNKLAQRRFRERQRVSPPFGMAVHLSPYLMVCIALLPSIQKACTMPAVPIRTHGVMTAPAACLL